MANQPKLTDLFPVAPFVLRVCFTDGAQAEISVAEMLSDADKRLFEQLKTEPELPELDKEGDAIHGIRWSNGVKIPAQKLYRAVEQAEGQRTIRGGTPEPESMAANADFLNGQNQLRYAAELYRKALRISPNNPDKKYWLKQLASAIYKDPDRPAAKKYDEALNFLGQAVDLPTTEESEYLGVAGAIYKRKWQFDNQYQNLLFSEHFYKRGTETWRKAVAQKSTQKNDNGYCAINYAYVLDLLAAARFKDTEQLNTPKISEHALVNLKMAHDVREEIILSMCPAELQKQAKQGKAIDFENLDKSQLHLPDNWAGATLGEAFFGIGQYEKALEFYKKYGQIEGLKDWQRRTTAEQLASLMWMQEQLFAMTQKLDKEDEHKAAADKRSADLFKILPFLNDHTGRHRAAESSLKAINRVPEAPSNAAPQEISFRGKVGLALSGGGFRASLFHIGVLARLAELDLLRHVEVLSCVSGGSIAGAYYYLLLKKAVEELPHGAKINYIQIVETMERDFRQAVQTNLRMQIFDNLKQNLEIVFTDRRTRTHRIADLYEQHLYRPILEAHYQFAKTADEAWTRDKSQAQYVEEQLRMHNLKMKPGGWPADQDFNPKYQNWNLEHKIPTLVLNATSLNTGHNWQFTASWMGEPPANIQQDVDARPRLRRMYYHEAPPPYTKNIRLGQAVGASACVPALFQPLLFQNLYPGIDLELVDGGVHDNQGIASLLEQECKIMLVSDASGQMPDDDARSGNELGVLGRADLVFQERIRENQFFDLKNREAAAQLNALAFVHLKRDLQHDPVNWKFCQEPPRTEAVETKGKNDDLTSYGIRRDVQEELAKLRTDLDAFHDAEAWALMHSGYAQTKTLLAAEHFHFLLDDANAKPNLGWQFLQIEKWMTQAARAPFLIKRLKVGQKVPFKVWEIYPAWVKTTFGYLRALVWLALILFALKFLLEAFFLGQHTQCDVHFNVNYCAILRLIALAIVGVPFFLWAVFRGYMAFYNEKYLNFGKLETLEKEYQASA